MLKASELVFLTQSALSLQVKRLEELLQFPVFSREGRRLALTPSGEMFLGYARRLLIPEVSTALWRLTTPGPAVEKLENLVRQEVA